MLSIRLFWFGEHDEVIFSLGKSQVREHYFIRSESPFRKQSFSQKVTSRKRFFA